MKSDFPRIYISAEIRRKMIEIARVFRKQPTKGEKILWNALRGKKLDGIKFRCQQPIGYFVVDFYSSAYRLVVEVNGPIHELQKEADAARQEILEELGLVVLRIKSEVVEKNSPAALDFIRDEVRTISQNKIQNIPSPMEGEGKGGG
jgi:adenine-specific DNA-methyltransferase